jgi:hypothetical protein
MRSSGVWAPRKIGTPVVIGLAYVPTTDAIFVDRDIAEQAIISYVEGHLTLDGRMRSRIFGAIAGVI